MQGISVQAQPFLGYSDQHVSANRDPQLRLHRVLAGAKERLDLQVLLDPLEEQLDMPTLAIQIADQLRIELEVVRQKRQPLARFVFDHHTTQLCGVSLLCLGQGQHTRLIANHGRIDPIDLLGVLPLELGIALGSGHKERLRAVQREQAREVQVTTVDKVESPSLPSHLVHHLDLVRLAVCDVHEGGNVASEIDGRVNLDRSFGLAKACPREHGQTQIDGARVEGINRLLQIDAKEISRIQRTRHADEVLRQIAVDLPRACGVGTRQGVSRDGVATKAHVIQTFALSAQVDLDVAQGFASRQLGKGHGKELIETGEVLNFVVAVVRVHATSKRAQWQVSHELCKNELALMHSGQGRWRAQSHKFGERSNRHQTKMQNSASISLTYEVSM